MRKNKKKNILAILVILVLAVSIGYAVLGTDLKIGGFAGITKKAWNIHWENVDNQSGVTPITEPVIGDDEDDNVDTQVEFTIPLNEPGDYYEFTVDAVNEGGLNAMITDVYTTVTPELPTFINILVTYADGGVIKKGQLFSKKTGNTETRETYRIRIEFKRDVTPQELDSISADGDAYNIVFGVTYGQADDTATARVPGLDNVSWSTIAANITNDPTTYPIETQKTVDMGKYGTHSVRIINNTTPSECSTTGFSQTACGVVWDFADIVTTAPINDVREESVNGTGSLGGWKYSKMRSFVNGDIYNSLPQDLKDVIVSTTVVSKAEFDDMPNYTTTDKIFLLSSMEINKSHHDYFINDEIYNYTRLADLYYEDDQYASDKKYGNAFQEWWTRDVSTGYTTNLRFEDVDNPNNGVFQIFGVYVDMNFGVTPAFKIGQ